MLYQIIAIILLGIPAAISFDIKEVPEDGKLNFTGLALKYAGAAEEYDVTTNDGYILKVFRIPGNTSRPILIVHGLMGSGNEFIMHGNDSFPIAFKNAGYDQWFCNYRGNRYSRRHVTMNPDTNRTFWEFGPHQHGTEDLPTCIDFVLNKTGERKLSLMGYSEGTLVTYILGSERPEYNDKIKIFIAMAPVCHLHYITKRLPTVIQFGNSLRSIIRRHRIEELGEFEGTRSALIRKFCAHTLVGIKACRRFVFVTSGFDAEGLEPEFMQTLFWQYPSGTSRMNLEHLLQIMVSKRFANYDYGPRINLLKYGSEFPPEYDMKRVTMRVFLLAAKNDRLAVLEDTRRQAKELPNLEEYMVVDNAVFNHIDFVWTRRSREVQPKVLQVLEKYN